MILPATLAGAIAGVVLAVAEGLWISFSVPPALPAVGGPPGLLIAAAPRGFVAGAMVGGVQGLLLEVIDRVSIWCARRRGHRAQWFAELVTTLVTVGAIVLGQPLMQGRQARALANPLLLALAGTAAVWCFYRIALVSRLAPHWFRVRAGQRRSRVVGFGVVVGLLIVASGAYVVDRLVLVRLYEPFHLGLRLVAFAALELALFVAWLLGRMPRSTDARAQRWMAALLATAMFALSFRDSSDSAVSRTAALNLMRLQGAIGCSLLDVTDLARPSRWSSRKSTAAAILPSAPTTAVTVEPLAPGANILLVTIDALRADHLQTYGYGRATSPRLSQFAHDNIVFDRAYTSAPHTSFALASLLTGHPAMSLSERGLLDDTPTLADLARAIGYRTAAFFPPAVFFVDEQRFRSFRDRAFGFEFTSVDNLPEASSARLLTDQVIAFLTDRTPERFLIWAHYFGPHEPYVAHDETGLSFGRTAVDRYDSEIRCVDQEVGRLIDSVRAKYPNTIVVVTADHGEEFGDHGGAYHGTSLYDEQVRVPLLLAIPGTAPNRVRAPVSTTSLPATVLDLVGARAEVDFDGSSLAPWLAPDTSSDDLRPAPVFAENAQQRMLVDEHDKLVCDTRRDTCALFDLLSDPAELVDTSTTRFDRARTLKAMMAGWVARQDQIRGRTDPWVRLSVSDPQSTPTARRDAARLLARRPDRSRAATLRGAWDIEADPVVKAWLGVALAALGDPTARTALPDLAAAAGDHDDELLGQAALARDRLADPRAVDELANALRRVADVNLRCALMHALAKWRTPLASSTLVHEYDQIRSRICCATAFSTLQDPDTVPFILERLPDEPYTAVQHALVRALGTIGDHRAVPVLKTLRDATPETDLIRTIDGALEQLQSTRPGT